VGIGRHHPPFHGIDARDQRRHRDADDCAVGLVYLRIGLVDLRPISSVADGTPSWDGVAIWTHALQKLEEITVGGKDKGCVFGDDGLV
jgi:hypothetical protein